MQVLTARLLDRCLANSKTLNTGNSIAKFFLYVKSHHMYPQSKSLVSPNY